LQEVLVTEKNQLLGEIMLSHLYIVESKGGLIKIGRSSCPKRRIAEIAKATGIAFPDWINTMKWWGC